MADGTDWTDWTQTNTLELKPTLAGRILAPLMARSLRRSTKQSMARAKGILEAT